jgi:hypothetical protein
MSVEYTSDKQHGNAPAELRRMVSAVGKANYRQSVSR